MADAVRLSSAVTGEGPLVVLLHEATENRHAWDPVVPLLAERFQVLTVDLRAHGESPRGDGLDLDDHVADLRAAVTAVDPDARPIVVGHGYGGLIAADYATWHPAAAVVVLDQHLGWAWSADPVAALSDTPTPDEVEAVLLHPAGYGPLPDDERDRLRALRRIDPEVLHELWAPLRKTSRDRKAWAEQALALPPGVPLVNVLSVDPGKRYADWVRHHVLGPMRVIGWPDGHYPHLVDPARLVEVVAESESTPRKKSLWARLFS
jgi:pimeloyl-ACP methyl ester carboxylesterase